MNKQVISEYLLQHSFCSGLDETFILKLSHYVNELEISKGELLFQAGEVANNFYIIRAGEILIQVPALMGPSLQVQLLKPEQVLGWSWLISPYQWKFQALAQEDTKLLEFDGNRILIKCEQEPKFGYELLKRFASLMSERLDASHQKMMDEWNPEGFA